MYATSSLSQGQREAAVSWFEQGMADHAVATMLMVKRDPVRLLYRRWRIHGRGALVTKATRPSYSFEFKRALVERFLAGEPAFELAAEEGLSSPTLLKKWAQIYRREGEDALRPKPKGRPVKSDESSGEVTELERLRRENERLRAEVAYLGNCGP